MRGIAAPRLLFGAAPRVSELWPEVPASLDALVAQMLARDPALRPSNGAHLAAALAALGPRMHTAAVAPREPAPRMRATTHEERRLLAVVMLGAAPHDGGPSEDLLRRAVVTHGGRLEQLADGSAIVVIDADRQAATDQAVRAARCALAMHALSGHRPLAIAMGRTESGHRLLEGDVIDRASQLLAHAARQPDGVPPIALDEISAGRRVTPGVERPPHAQVIAPPHRLHASRPGLTWLVICDVCNHHWRTVMNGA